MKRGGVMAISNKYITDKVSGSVMEFSYFFKWAFYFLDILCIIAHIFYVAIFTYIGVLPLCIFNLFSVMMYVALLYFVTKDKYNVAGTAMIIEIILHVVIATVILGWNFGFTYQLLTIIAVSFFLPYKKFYQCFVLSGLSFAAFFGLWFYCERFAPLYSSSRIELSTNLIYIINCCFAIIPLFLESYMFRITSEKAEALLFERNQDLILLASVDPLTNLLNRRSMEQKLDMAYKRRELVFDPFCVVISDIDDFKAFNDTYGHDCGDFVLKTISDIFRDTLRSSDNVARWGGEEILVLLNSTDVGSAIQVVERLRTNIANYDFHFGGQRLNITMTFGLSWKKVGVTEMLKDADEHLYFGKAHGKNQIVYDRNPNEK